MKTELEIITNRLKVSYLDLENEKNKHKKEISKLKKMSIFDFWKWKKKGENS